VSGFDVDPEALRDHARHLDTVAALVDEAVEAAEAVSADESAFGLLVGPMLTPWVNQVEQGGVDATRHAAESVRATAKSVRDTAAQYEQADRAVETAFRTTFLEQP
jgi:hypothetical protein